MNTMPALTNPDQRTWEKIFQHPLSHNLAWHDVHGLLARMGHVVARPKGGCTVTCQGETIVLPETHTKEVATDDLVRLRHFLQRTENTQPAAPTGDRQLLLVINHHEGRIFHLGPAQSWTRRILPHDAGVRARPTQRTREFSRGQEKPAPNDYFAPLARALHDAGRILVFGGGKGMASEMEQFVTWLQAHHPELARRIAGTRVIDEHHLTDAQLLAQARDFYRGAGPTA